MDYSVPLFMPLDGCKCFMCERARVAAERAKLNRDLIPGCPCCENRAPVNPFGQAVNDLYNTLSQIKPIPFEPEPAAPEPVYTHVLLDYDEDTPLSDIVELHTAESLVEAIASRKDGSSRFVVYQLGESILDVAGE
jgi:hypothetical protein